VVGLYSRLDGFVRPCFEKLVASRGLGALSGGSFIALIAGRVLLKSRVYKMRERQCRGIIVRL
jgi:hypothetical protein